MDGMNAEIKAAASFAEKLGIDVDSDFQRHHRQRRVPRRIDDKPDTAANLDVESFHRKEFKAVLHTQISTFTDVLENCVASSPEKNHHHFKLMNFHPESGRPDPNALMSEVKTFTLHTKADVKDTFGATKKVEEMKLVFPMTNIAYRLVLRAPVTVAQDERTFSKLKIVKNLCRSRTSDERLEALLFLANLQKGHHRRNTCA